jgi:hypothetical protein
VSRLERSFVVVLFVCTALLAGVAARRAEASPGDGPWVSSVTGSRNPSNSSELEILVVFTAPLDPSTLLAGQTVQLTTSGNQQVPIAAAELDAGGTTLDIRVEGAGSYESLSIFLAGDSSSASAVIAGLDGTPLGANASNPQGRDYTGEVAPTVTSVAVPAAGIYGVGEPLDFVVTMSEPTVVDTTGGIPSLPIALEDGTTVDAAYRAGSGTEALTFRYSVAEGDVGGISIGAALQLGGGALTDAAGFAAVPTLNNVASASGISLDGTVPVPEPEPEPHPQPALGPSPTQVSSTSSLVASVAAPAPSQPAATARARCTSRRTAVIHLLAPHGVHLRRATLRLDGRLLATLGRGVTTVPVSFVGRPPGTVTLVISATTRAGIHLISSRQYHLCSSTPLPSGNRSALHRVR